MEEVKLFCDICISAKSYYIVCTCCNKDACTDCYEKYYYGKDMLKCMFCNYIFELDFVVKQLGQEWYEVYLNYLVDNKIRDEIEKLPKAQELIVKLKYLKENMTGVFFNGNGILIENSMKYIEKYIEFVDIVFPDFSRFFEEYLEINEYQQLYYDDIRFHDNFDKIESIQRYINTEFKINIHLSMIITYYNSKLFYVKEEHITEIKNIICKCLNKNCNGYIFSENYKCDLCNTKICKKCHILLTKTSHICNKDDVENVEYVKKNSKNCPNCFMPISKIEGCDQMWCVACHTAFSWETGRIVKNKDKIHNPHYFEWLYTNKNNTENIEENDLENVENNIRNTFLIENNINAFDRFFYDKNRPDKYINRCLASFVEEILETYRIYVHTENVILENLQDNYKIQLKIISLRLKYITNKITIEKWKKELTKILHEMLYKNSMVTVFKNFRTKISELYRSDNIKNNIKNMPKYIIKYIQKIREVFIELNNSLNDISIIYNISIPVINDLFNFYYKERHVYEKDLQNIINDEIKIFISSTSQPIIFYKEFDLILTQKIKKGMKKPAILKL